MSSFVGYRVRIPAWAEFAARLAHASTRRLRPARSPRSPVSKAVTRSPALEWDVMAEALSRLGIRRGGCLMVHSSSDSLGRLGWEPTALINFLLDYLGPEGTLAMPSHPKLTQDDNGRLIYDVRRSVSTVGLITELFRRRKGVVRSQFPFSAVVALGPHAEELTSAHARSVTPHDENSPYAKLGELDGQVLHAGVPLDKMTIFHVAEDSERGAMPIAGFHQPVEVFIKSGDELRKVAAYRRSPWLWWYLHMAGWKYDMYHRGFARPLALQGVPFWGAEARPLIEWMRGEVRAGRTYYPLARMNRWLKLEDPHARRIVQ